MNNHDFARVALAARLRDQSNANMSAHADADRTRLQAITDQAVTDSHTPATMEELVAAASDVDVVLAAFNDAPIDKDDETFIDYEAIAWAYQKLLAYGVGNTGMENALMLDRLNLMLLAAP